MALKMAILIRRDIPIPAGKLAVQVGHAVEGWAIDVLAGERPISDDERAWLRDPLKRKICLAVNDLAELEALAARARSLGIDAHIVTDAGLTVFPEPTVTCCAIGPSARTDEVTRNLKLYR